MKAVLSILLLSFAAGGTQEANCKFCMGNTCTPSISGIPPSNFDPTSDYRKLNYAMSGFSTDNDAIIAILTTRSASQRQVIVDEFTKKKANLVSSLCKKTSGRFMTIMSALATPVLTFYTKELSKAITAKDRVAIGEILACLTPCMARQVSRKYQEIHDRSLFDDLNQIKMNDLLRFSNWDYIALVQSLAQGDRETNTTPDHGKAVNDAKRLKSAGVGSFGTDEAVFFEIFTKLSISQLAETLRQYEALRRQDGDFSSLENDINSEFSSTSLRECLMNIARNALDQPLYFAQEIEKIMNTYMMSNAEEAKLIRIMRGRGDIDMEEIKIAYEREYKQTLQDKITKSFPFNSRLPKTLLGIVTGKS